MINLVGPQYEPLTPEEVATLWPIAKAGNEKARERLICSTLRSVVAECYKYVTAYDIDELLSMALYIAVECFETFDPAKGMQYYSYVVVSVRWKINVLITRSQYTMHTNDIRLLEALGGYEETADTDEERHREERNETIRNYFLSLPQMTVERFERILKNIEERNHPPQGTRQALKGIKPTADILQAITQVIGAETAAKAITAHEEKERHKLEAIEKSRARCREYERKKREKKRIERNAQREAKCAARAEQRKNDRIQARTKRELDKAHAKELKAIERQKIALQRIMEKQKTERQTAVDNFNTLYEFIIKHTDARPMEAEAAAYMTLQGFDTLKAWSDRHGLVYESVKRWRMYVKRKLAALNDVDEDIIALDRSLFKS